MQELIAKRYVKALGVATGSESLANIAELFNAITAYFANKSFLQIMENPEIAKSEKSWII